MYQKVMEYLDALQEGPSDVLSAHPILGTTGRSNTPTRPEDGGALQGFRVRFTGDDATHRDVKSTKIGTNLSEHDRRTPEVHQTAGISNLGRTNQIGRGVRAPATEGKICTT